MDASLPVSLAVKQTTVATCILRIVFQEVAMVDNRRTSFGVIILSGLAICRTAWGRKSMRFSAARLTSSAISSEVTDQTTGFCRWKVKPTGVFASG